MKHFVIEFDHEVSKVVSMVQYDDKKDATNRWIDLKQLVALSSAEIEVLMFDAENLDALRAEHPQYFGGLR